MALQTLKGCPSLKVHLCHHLFFDTTLEQSSGLATLLQHMDDKDQQRGQEEQRVRQDEAATTQQQEIAAITEALLQQPNVTPWLAPAATPAQASCRRNFFLDYLPPHLVPFQPTLPALRIDQQVRVRNPANNRWYHTGTVVAQPKPDQYDVRLPNGRILRRDRLNLRPVNWDQCVTSAADGAGTQDPPASRRSERLRLRQRTSQQ